MVRGRNVDVAADSQEPHGQKVDTTVIIGRGQVRDEGHRKELVNLGGLFSAMSGEWPVTFLLLLQEAAFDMMTWSATDGVASTISTEVAIFLLLLLSPFLHSIIEFDAVY